MPIARHLIDEIVRRSDIVTVVGEYVALKERGSGFWGLSPFNNEKTPSFSVSRSKGLYYCFSSHKGGTVFNFIMEMENLSFPEAVEFLGRKVGVDVSAGIDDKRYNEQKQMYELYSRIGHSLHYILLNSERGKAARAYMNARGIEQATLERYCIGYAPADPSWLHRFLLSKGYSQKFMQQSGLFSKQSANRSLFVDRVIFPIFSPRGEIIAFSGRRLAEYGPKYLNSPDTLLFQKRRHLFGLYQATEHKRQSKAKTPTPTPPPPSSEAAPSPEAAPSSEAALSQDAAGRWYIVEGNIDVLAMYQAGFPRVVAPLGTAFGLDQARLLKRYSEEVTLIFDTDPSGLQATQRATETLERTGVHGSVCLLSAGSDPAEILEKNGPQVLRENVHTDTIVESFEYLLQKSLAGAHKRPETKNNAVGSVLSVLFPYIVTVDSAIRREQYLFELADRLGVGRQTVTTDFEKYAETGRVPVNKQGKQMQIAPISDELFLMLATVSNRDQFPHVRNAMNIADIRDPIARSLLIAMEECYRRDERSLEALLTRIENEHSRQIVLSELATDKYRVNSEELVHTTMSHIQARRLQERRQELIRRIESLDKKDERDREGVLQQELIYLNEELENIERQEIQRVVAHR